MSLHRRMKVMRMGVKALTSPPLSAGYWQSTMFQPWRILSFNPANFGQSPTISEHHEEHLPWGYRHCNLTCQWVVFTSSYDEGPVRASGWCPQNSSTDASSSAHMSADLSSPDHHNQHHYHTATPNVKQFFKVLDNVAWDDDASSSKEHFPTAPLDGVVWSEDPNPDRHLCIHVTSHELNLQGSYSYPYRNTTFRMDLPQATLRMKQYFTMS